MIHMRAGMKTGTEEGELYLDILFLNCWSCIRTMSHSVLEVVRLKYNRIKED